MSEQSRDEEALWPAEESPAEVGARAEEQWRPDILGHGFQQLTLPLEPDDEGAVVATLVRALPRFSLWPKPLHDVDVLFVHGWSDYFFNRTFARWWTDRGARFFALDLRKYGRSLREGQTPGFITSLDQYDEDIEAALAARGRGTERRRLVLVGHSTGGLTLSLWTARHPGRASAVVLNSPWLEFQLSGLTRTAIAPLLGLHSRLRPMDAAPQIDLGFYTRAQAEAAVADDPMTIDPAWRPEKSMTVHAGWLYAILDGHARVAAGLGIDVPVQVLLSSRSAAPTRWSEDLVGADSVLAVDEVARAALKLGSTVTIERLDGALHDVFLSRRDVRAEAYARMDRWVEGFIAR